LAHGGSNQYADVELSGGKDEGTVKGIQDPPYLTCGVCHGGDLAAARAAFPDAPEPWLDLSTGINPIGYPLPALAPEIWSRLPDRGRLRRLERVAAERYGVANGATVVAAPGTQALIQALARLRGASKIGILDFTYAEYETVWREAGAKPYVVDTLETLAGFDVAVVVNPNNPDGRLIPRQGLVALASKMAQRGGILIVDEAFMDVMPAGYSLAPTLPEGVVVLRSFGKTYGLAGVRLGFAIASPALGEELRSMLGPWAVSGPAIEIGCAGLADEAWLANTIAHLLDRAAALDLTLLRHGYALIGGSPLFRLVGHPNARFTFAALAKQGVLVRRFPTRREWLRIAPPGDRAALDRLNRALERAREMEEAQ
jgi:cobalamin biosynthetic protein CobC